MNNNPIWVNVSSMYLSQTDTRFGAITGAFCLNCSMYVSAEKQGSLSQRNVPVCKSCLGTRNTVCPDRTSTAPRCCLCRMVLFLTSLFLLHFFSSIAFTASVTGMLVKTSTPLKNASDRRTLGKRSNIQSQLRSKFHIV